LNKKSKCYSEEKKENEVYLDKNNKSKLNKEEIDENNIFDLNYINNQNNLFTISTNNLNLKYVEIQPQSNNLCVNKNKKFMESKKSMDEIPINLFENLKSRNKNFLKNSEIKSLNVRKNL